MPDGFVVTVHACQPARAALDDVIRRAAALDPEDTVALQAIADDARRILTHIFWKSILLLLLAAGLLCAGGGLLLRVARGAEITRQDAVARD